MNPPAEIPWREIAILIGIAAITAGALIIIFKKWMGPNYKTQIWECTHCLRREIIISEKKAVTITNIAEFPRICRVCGFALTLTNESLTRPAHKNCRSFIEIEDHEKPS